MNTNKSRCECCQKKLPLTAFACRCGGFYCSAHRPDNEHKCTYDYKAEAMKSLSTNLVKIGAKKVEVI